nr:ulp1 protease family protein [Colletotrichum truncatum]KAF6785587.1 ulp1 protease family protein [Colletotrichum truncatum]
MSQQSTSPENDSSGEDDLGKDEPPNKKQAKGQPKSGPKSAAKRTILAKHPRRTPEGISDSEIEKLDELALESVDAKRRQRAEAEDISGDEDTLTPITPGSRRARADISPVYFSSKKRKVDKPIFRLKRAVSGKHRLTITDLPVEDQPILQVDDDAKHLVAVDGKGEKRLDYHWLDVKLNFCTKVQHTAGTVPLAAISRPAGGTASPLLVLEFAEANDALRFANWVEEKSASWGNRLKIICEPEDSDQLQKIFKNQWNIATNYKPMPSLEPGSGKYSSVEDSSKTDSVEQSVAQSGSRPTPQQNTPYRPSHSLRSSMNTEAPKSAPSSSTRTSSYFVLSDEKDARLETRQTRALPPRQSKDAATRHTLDPRSSILSPRSPSPVPWMEQNPDWANIWDDRPLIFPAVGKNRASVYRDDMARLEEGQFMNDNLIGFYSRYLQIKLEQENNQMADRIYFMNTYFYPRLTEKAGRSINYDGVKTWTAKVDLFSYDYIIVPVNEQAHWYLAIICHPSKLIKSEKADAERIDEASSQQPQKEGLVSAVGEQVQQMSLDDTNSADDPRSKENEPNLSVKSHTPRKTAGALSRKKDPSEARVITLDSLGVGHSATCGNLKEYLVREAKDKKKMDIEPPAQFGMTAKGIPEQLDHASCGAFLLGYLREFLKNPDHVVSLLVRKEKVDWPITSLEMRGELRNIIIEQRKEQNQRLSLEKKAKRKSNNQSRIVSKSPEKEPSGEPATPSTPMPLSDAPKNPSSTVKGSPGAASHHRASPPAEEAMNKEVASTDRAEPIEPSDIPLVPTTTKSNELPQPTRSASTPRVKTPPPSQPQDHATSPLRTSPRNRKRKTSDSAIKTPQPKGVILSSPPLARLTSERRQTSNGLETGPTTSGGLRSRVASSSKPTSIPSERSIAIETDRSLSPSQQILSELRDSPSKSNQAQRSASNEAKSHIQSHQRKEKIGGEPLNKPAPLTLTEGNTETSPHFPTEPSTRTKSSPTSAAKPRQLSVEETYGLRSKFEDNGGPHEASGVKTHKHRQPVTVDLTD